MGEHEVDARGLDCPQPVIMTRKQLEQTPDATIRVLVDDAVQAENVAAMARNQGWDVRISGDDDGYLTLTLGRSGSAAVETGGEDNADACGVRTKVVVQFASDKFGAGADELGDILMRSFIKTINEIIPRPQVLIFVNSGVKLTTEGSEVADDLHKLSESGMDVINCGTCLDYFNLKDKLLVGRISNMYEIATQLATADRVVKP